MIALLRMILNKTQAFFIKLIFINLRSLFLGTSVNLTLIV
jgi:hypothetical protein